MNAHFQPIRSKNVSKQKVHPSGKFHFIDLTRKLNKNRSLHLNIPLGFYGIKMYFSFLAVESYNVSSPYEKVDINACYLIKLQSEFRRGAFPYKVFCN